MGQCEREKTYRRMSAQKLRNIDLLGRFHTPPHLYGTIGFVLSTVSLAINKEGRDKAYASLGHYHETDKVRLFSSSAFKVSFRMKISIERV